MSQKCQKGDTLAWHDTNEAVKEMYLAFYYTMQSKFPGAHQPLCMTVSRCLSAYGCACLCPTDSEGQNAMQ